MAKATERWLLRKWPIYATISPYAEECETNANQRGIKTARSSMVEHPAYIGRVLGSSPSGRTLK